MLVRRENSHGLVYYSSPLLESAEVRHAFSTRLGGLSPAPFDSLNLGNPNGCEIQDPYERIWENYAILHRAIGADERPPCRVHQVHGAGVLRVKRGETFDTSQKADALVSDDATRVLSIRVADCVPVLMAKRDGSRVAAIHAGWRGVIAGVVAAAFREMAGGDSATEYLAAIGPCIGYDAFEVGPEVLDEFASVFGPSAPTRKTPDGKGRVDLRQAIQRQLNSIGFTANQIDTTDRCTYRDKDEFFSHRRDNGVTGRMAAVIQAREARRHVGTKWREAEVGWATYAHPTARRMTPAKIVA